MQKLKILIVGAGIGGLTSATALCQQGFQVEAIDRDPAWSVYGVGIIQQGNVLRAMNSLGLLEAYLDSGFGYDHAEVYLPDGSMAVRMPSPKLANGYPANIGIRRTTLHKVLGDRAIEAGCAVRLGITVTSFLDDGGGVDVQFSDGSTGRYDIVIGADGLYSTTRSMLFPESPPPEFTGQAVWRYNFPRPPEVDCIQAFPGRIGVGLVPISPELMYLFATTAEPGNPRYPPEQLAESMRGKLAGAAPQITALAEQITDSSAVVYRPLEYLFIDGDWHRGRIVLLGDAVHSTTPHLAQGAGMAIEDSVVLAEELGRAATPEEAFQAYHRRRFDRCAFISRKSLAVCKSQLGEGPPVDHHEAIQEMLAVIEQPI